MINYDGGEETPVFYAYLAVLWAMRTKRCPFNVSQPIQRLRHVVDTSKCRCMSLLYVLFVLGGYTGVDSASTQAKEVESALLSCTFCIILLLNKENTYEVHELAKKLPQEVAAKFKLKSRTALTYVNPQTMHHVSQISASRTSGLQMDQPIYCCSLTGPAASICTRVRSNLCCPTSTMVFGKITKKTCRLCVPAADL